MFIYMVLVICRLDKMVISKGNDLPVWRIMVGKGPHGGIIKISHRILENLVFIVL